MLSGSLRLAGFEVMAAASGAVATRAVVSGRPDLVLLDVMMPDGDGSRCSAGYVRGVLRFR